MGPKSSTVCLKTARIDSPLGPLSLAVRGDSLVAVVFGPGLEPVSGWLSGRFGPWAALPVADPGRVVSRLGDYFAGDAAALDRIEVDTGGTPFQLRVWAALRRIPAGHTWSYGRLAREIDAPSAVRAVGAANGRNPVPVVVPCHRVVAADGTLWGYGGGLERKRWLLEHEGALARGGAVVGQGRLFE